MNLKPLLLFSVLTVSNIRNSLAQMQDCSTAPSDALAIFCEQLQRWDFNTRQQLLRPFSGPQILPPGFNSENQGQWQPEFSNNQVQLPIPRSPQSCMEISCLCQFLNGRIAPDSSCFLSNGRRLGQAVRKEYRRLTEDERNRFHDAMNQVKRNGDYDNLARIHAQTGNSGSAHSGPGFLPWHREFTKRLEIALRLIDPDMAMPYWDSVLDQPLPDPRDSIVWSPLFFGESDSVGNVINGPFANWRTLEGRNNLQRHLGAQGALFSENQLNTFNQKNNIANVLAHTTPGGNCPFQRDFTAPEYVHGNVHFWVGGDMTDQSKSANDPSFFLHHSFLDLIWERWRQERQSRWERESVYPDDIVACSNQQHFRNAEMRPFENMRNIDGLSNRYTDELYTFEPRPTCSFTPDCGSIYIFCDRSHGQPRCVSKVKLSGRCDGFEQEDICFGGICVNGRCVEGQNSLFTMSAQPVPTAAVTRPPPPRRTRPPVVFNNCFNEHPCCKHWAGTGECSRNAVYMNKWCLVSCNQCQPSFDISAGCSDHHESCRFWERRGECTKNALWMEENCPESCGQCGRSVSNSCMARGGRKPSVSEVTTVAPVSVVFQQDQTTPRRRHHHHSSKNKAANPISFNDAVQSQQPVVPCKVTQCYNEDKCCDEWRKQGKCTTNAAYMQCNCKVSCGVCQPDFTSSGTCDDYHRSCSSWRRAGECSKNPWMLENCRTSCQTCLNFPERRLRRQCRA